MPIVPLETERLRLRPLVVDDVAEVFAILGHDVTTANVSWRQTDVESTRRWVCRRIEQERELGVSMWVVEHKESREMLGLVGFFPGDLPEVELGYVLHAEHWGKGVATEAVDAAVTAATGAGYEVFATIRPMNDPSLAVARRAGLVETGAIEDERGTLLVFRRPG